MVPLAKGVVVSVNRTDKSVVMHAIGYGRLRINLTDSNILILQPGAWISVEIRCIRSRENGDCFNYKFICASEPKSIDDILPTFVNKASVIEQSVRLETPVFVGTVLPGGSVGLSPCLGRIYFPKEINEQFALSSAQELGCGVVSIEPNDENFFCFWEVRRCAVLENDFKLRNSVRLCFGVADSFPSKNVCILKLNNNEGFAVVRSTDFVHSINGKSMIESAKSIQVYAAQELDEISDYPVPVCYARIINERVNGASEAMAEDVFTISVPSTAVSSQRSEKAEQESLSLEENENYVVCDPRCKSIAVVKKLLCNEELARAVNEIDENVYNDMKAFLIKYG